MILADTSVWISHFRESDARLAALLDDNMVAMHPFVLGELACGALQDRKQVLGYMKALPTLSAAEEEDVLYLIEQHQLMAEGLGYIDMHLLAAVKMSACRLWTLDRRLMEAAGGLGNAYA